jgi:hypothetical protein
MKRVRPPKTASPSAPSPSSPTPSPGPARLLAGLDLPGLDPAVQPGSIPLFLAPQAGARLKEGQKQRQQKRDKQRRAVRAAQRDRDARTRLANRTDYLVDDHGDVRRPDPQKIVGNFFRQARQEQAQTAQYFSSPAPDPLDDNPRARKRARVDDTGETPRLSVDTSTLQGKVQASVDIPAFYSTRTTDFSVQTTGGKNLGSLAPAALPWFKMPDDAAFNAGEPSLFGKPVGDDGTALKTTYHNDAGLFSTSSFDARDTDEQAGRLLVVSGAEGFRGAGAGPAQVLAQEVAESAGVEDRNEMYGTEKGGPGFYPAGYSGSQADIALTEHYALNNDPQAMENPTAMQTDEVLAVERRQRRPKLARRASDPALARARDYLTDTEEMERRIGLSRDSH